MNTTTTQQPNVIKYSYWARRSDDTLTPSIRTSSRQTFSTTIQFEYLNNSTLRTLEINEFLAIYKWLYNS